MDPDAGAHAALALWLSGGALLVALAAAGFTFWQAITAHLARAVPRPPTFRLVYPSMHGDAWSIANTGGSLATDVTVTVWLVKRNDSFVLEAVGVVDPGEKALLSGSENKVDPRKTFKPEPKPGTTAYDYADPGEPGAWHPFGKVARVEYRDRKNRVRSAKVPMY